MGGETITLSDSDSNSSNDDEKKETNNKKHRNKNINSKVRNNNSKSDNECNSSKTSSSKGSSTKASSSSSNIKSNHNNKEEDEGDDEEENQNKENTNDAEKKQQFCVAPTKNEFKLRIVPIEKLLQQPPVQKETRKREAEPKKKTKEVEEITKRKRLPERKNRNNISIVDSESSSDEENDVDCFIVEENKTKSFSTTSRKAVNKKKETSSAATSAVKCTDKRIKRCAVRIKRTPWPEGVKFPTKEKANMNGNQLSVISADHQYTKTKPTKRKRTSASSVSSDEDPDFNVRAADDDDDVDNKIDGSKNSSDDDDDKSSASEIIPVRKKRGAAKERKNSDSDFEPRSKQSKKRGRILKHSSDDSDDDDDEKNKNKRKHIRKIIKTKDLDISTKTATKEEEDRRKRIDERQKVYNQIYEKPDSIEVNELVLDFDEKTKEALLQVDKGLLKKLKPHQVTGVKFMWDACFETLSEADEKPGSGCILAHCMGLGKTLQIVTLTHTLLVNSRKTNVERVLIISPLSTLNNWAREYAHWMRFARKKDIEVYDMSRFKDKATRIYKLNEWHEEGGVCIIGYDMYRILANEKAKGLRKNQRETLQKSLVDPGPDMVVCDEGHLLKNEKTSISQAVTKMRTKRRIVLTGTPLQNNLKEYYCMIQFVKPNLLGTYKEYLNRFVNPITNGQYTDSTERDIRLMKHRSHILHKMLEGCIQRRDYSVLAPYLPPKHEYVVYTTLSDAQQQLYEYYMTTQRDLSGSDIGGKGARLFQDFQDLRRIWTHPMNLRVNSDSVIRKRLIADDSDSMEDFICDDDEEDLNASSSDSSVNSVKSFASGGDADGNTSKRGSKKPSTRNNRIDDDSDIEDIRPAAPQLDPSEWWKCFVEEKELNNLNHSPKLVILMKLLQQCEAIGDKLLVFSQSLQSLDVIEHFLALIDRKTKGQEYEGDIGDFHGNWAPGKDYFRLDGSCSVESREVMCKKFNDTSNLRARLFLISTRAGGLGINLVAANRVVIFDVSWNPSHDTQSIFRVYRFGQDKPCYIYRLIAMGTMEQKVYERQVAKQATAKRVIDEQQISRHYNQSDLQELYTYELKPTAEREIPNLPKDRLFAELLSEHEKLIFKYHEHDSLLENEESENLSEAERKAAWSEYEAEKTRSVQTAQFISYDRSAYGGQFGNASGSVTSNKIFGFRSDVLLTLLNMKVAKDHPELTRNQILQLVPSYLNQLYVEMNNGDPTMYKDLLSLNQSLEHPTGVYMNPLLYANQDPSAAGYVGATAEQPQTSSGGGAAPVGIATVAAPSAPGFDPNQVYEID